MFYDVKNAESAKKNFPEGTRIHISYISDGSYPNAVGKDATVKWVDDIGQVSCVTDDGYSATLCHEYGDNFYKIGD